MPKVIVQFQGQEYSVDLREGSNVIGRSSKCTIPLRDTNTSREHCEIHFATGVATVLDKGSMNGTLVNGKKVAEHRLAPGDKIVIGQTSIFYESKPAGTPTAAAVQPPSPTPEVGTQPGKKADSEIRKAAVKPPGKPETRRGVSVSALIKDYALMGSDRGGLMGAVIGSVVGLLVIGGILVFLFKGAGGGATDDDPDNLLKHGDFEVAAAGGVQGWALAKPYKSSLSIDGTQAHHGKSALHIDKKGDASDLIVEVVSVEQFPLHKATRVEASAYAKCDGFVGTCAIKINWLTNVNGPVILEELSDAVVKPADWTPLRKEFVAPPGAGAFSVALVAVGRSGHVYFDEAKAAPREGAAAPKETLFAPFTFSISPAGLFIVGTEDHRVLANVGLALDSTKDGQTTQMIAEGVKVAVDDKKIEIKGKLANPADLQGVNFEIAILVGAEGEVHIGVRCTGEGMKVVDRMLLTMLVPRADRIAGLPTATESGTPRVTVVSEGVDVVLEYAELMKVTAEVAGRGAKRLVHSVGVESATGDASLRITLRRGAGTGPRKDPLRDAKQAEDKQAFGDALKILQESLKTVREPAVRDQIFVEIKRHLAHEAGDWSDVQAKCFMARISGRNELFTSALDEIAGYQRRWAGDPFGAKVQQLREEIEKNFSDNQGAGDEDRARRILDQAKAYREKGQRAMAQTLCELILSRFVATKSAAEAQEVLKSVRQ